ncbi:MAG: VOC family protein [Bryobacterales bacterium]|nr:VOC family protein [Bryobacteraceae bacterium]MDW8131905.1 VOC family protein [Bryobacterales bacterium]
MIQGIEHVAIASVDPEKLARWYAGTLGFVINYSSGRTFFVRAPNGAMIEIIAAEGERAPAGEKSPGLRHIALLVDDFDAAYRALQAAQVEFVGEPVESKGNRVVFFKDPEGNLLHLLQRAQPLP